MKRHAFGVLKASVTLFVITCIIAVLAVGSVRAAAQTTQITILHVSDTHSHLAAWGPKDSNLEGTIGGLPKAASIIAAEKSADPEALFIHAGDFMDGDLFFTEYLGVPELQILRSLGLDALVLGNHEFVFGPSVLEGVLQTAWPSGGVTVLGTNLDRRDTAYNFWVTTAVKEIHGIKVGLFGLIPPNDAVSRPKPLKVAPYLPTIAPQAVSTLRASGAQVVICVAHIGIDAAKELAEQVPGIDVIVNGHDNAVLQEPQQVGTTLIVSAGNYYRWVGRLRLSVEGTKVSLVDYALLSVDATTLASAPVQNEINGLKSAIVDRYGDVYHQPVAWAELELSKSPDPDHTKRDTALGNLVTDAYRAQTGADIALDATGYLGDPLPQGTIVGADIFRSMSYVTFLPGPPATVQPWRLKTFRTTGADLLHALDTTLTLGGDYFPQVSGLRMDYNPSGAEPYGDYFGTKHKILIDSVHVGGHKLIAERIYSVTVTEGVFSALQTIFAVAGLKMQEVQDVPTSGFDAARLFAAFRGQLGLATSNRIHDISASSGGTEF